MSKDKDDVIKHLRDKLQDLALENGKLKAIIDRYKLPEESDFVTDIELTCRNEILKLRDTSESTHGILEDSEVKALDIVTKVLSRELGTDFQKKGIKGQQADVRELLKVVSESSKSEK